MRNADFDPKLNKIAILTIEQEKALTIEYKANPSKALADKIIMGNWRYAAKAAHQFSRKFPNVSAHELFHEGLNGMMDALNRFDPEKSYAFSKARFTSYAKLYIQRYMQVYVMKNMCIITQHNIKQVREQLFFKNKPEGNHVFTHVSSNIVMPDSDEVLENNFIDESPNSDAQYEQASSREHLKQSINKLINDLNEKEKVILQERFMAEDTLTLQEIADKFGVTRERIRQLEERVLEKAKRYIMENDLEECYS